MGVGLLVGDCKFVIGELLSLIHWESKLTGENVVV